jgi:phosphomannomutase/phosphoglucomutase
VLLDCGNGASSITSPTLLHRLGAQYVTLNATMDGTFPAHDSEPTEANVQGLVQGVKAVGAELGVAHDGDADRSVFVDEAGRYVPGEKILTLIAREVIKAQGGGVVVTPVTSSDSVAEAVAPFGGTVVYTRVGSPVVSRIMKEKRGAIGGEENGGLILAEHQIARDGAMTLAKVLEILTVSGQPLSELIRSLPPYHLVKEKVRCPVALRGKLLEALPEILDTTHSSEVTTLDGIKVRTSTGWVLVRPSGTEAICRIFAESREVSLATDLARTTAQRVGELVASLETSPKDRT